MAVDVECHMSVSDLAAGTGPTIVAPVSRELIVADLQRSVAFYRDVLGFDVGSATATNLGALAAEAVRGPARLRLTTKPSDLVITETHSPRCSAVVFFEVDDVAAMRDAIRAGGGDPSGLENANWIKMQVFEIRDPDGHVLWFGKSFHVPDTDAPSSQCFLEKALPELPLDNVAAGIAYFRDVLGFKVNYAQHNLGVMDRDRVTILLIARTQQHKGIGSCYVYIRDADALHAELTRTAAVVLDQPVSQPWGLREFHVLDLEGNRITFGQPFE
jgi:catechol 2,3-dioxygenase-like lactoylglutathione lyase family enzyme